MVGAKKKNLRGMSVKEVKDLVTFLRAYELGKNKGTIQRFQENCSGKSCKLLDDRRSEKIRVIKTFPSQRAGETGRGIKRQIEKKELWY